MENRWRTSKPDTNRVRALLPHNRGELMFAIVTRKGQNGRYDDVGMSNRTPVSDLKTEAGLACRMRRRYQPGTYRVQLYRDSHDVLNYKTFYVEVGPR